MAKRTSPSSAMPLSGERLVGDFLAALTNRMAVETAHVVAEQSEKETLQTLAVAGGAHADGYLSPHNIPASQQEQLVRSSVDAHVKKIQAEQVRVLAANQLNQMQTENQATYLNRKAVIGIIDPSANPIESYWFNEQTGQENIGNVKSASVRGVIRGIDLDKNLLIIEPGWGSKLINPARKYFLVYVINPYTLVPAVKINLV